MLASVLWAALLAYLLLKRWCTDRSMSMVIALRALRRPLLIITRHDRPREPRLTMTLAAPILASRMNPMFPVAAVLAIVLILAGCSCLSRKKRRAAGVSFLLGGLCSWYAATNLIVASQSYERDAISDCRSFYQAQTAYAQANNGSFGSPKCLANPETCGFPPGFPVFLDPELASLQPTREYKSFYIPGRKGTGNPESGHATLVYLVTPMNPGTTAIRTFAIDHTGLLCQTMDGTVPAMENGELVRTCAAVN